MLGFFLHSPLVQVTPSYDSSARVIPSSTKYKNLRTLNNLKCVNPYQLWNIVLRLSPLSPFPFGKGPFSSLFTSSPSLYIFTLPFFLPPLSFSITLVSFVKFCAPDPGFKPNTSLVLFVILNWVSCTAHKFPCWLLSLVIVSAAMVKTLLLGSALSLRHYHLCLSNYNKALSESAQPLLRLILTLFPPSLNRSRNTTVFLTINLPKNSPLPLKHGSPF